MEGEAGRRRASAADGGTRLFVEPRQGGFLMIPCVSQKPSGCLVRLLSGATVSAGLVVRPREDDRRDRAIDRSATLSG
jgi:hypothetical protein